MFFNKIGHRLLHSGIVIILALALATPALAAFTPATYAAARHVLGQANFTSHTAAVTQKGMTLPSGVAVDPITHKVFVADRQNNRVLRYASLYSLANGAAADAVFGQKTFTAHAAATTQHGMRSPYGVFVDKGGRLWVSDTLNHRILRFDHASTLASGANANGVLGQPNFTSSGAHITQKGLDGPLGLFVDGHGRLWVADSVNSRVLRYNGAASKANGANADGVLGQADFVTTALGTTQNLFSIPYGVTVDTGGRLWVADAFNNRVLRFDAAASKANGANADGVLGQANFTSNAVATTQNGMSSPYGVATDASGSLYVADFANNRILIYSAAAGLANGANANFVLGQTSFTSNTANVNGLSAKSLHAPFGLFYDPHAQVLFAADQGNRRVLMYGKPTP